MNTTILSVGTKVIKFSNKPFKSKLKCNTISGYTIHPKTLKTCYTFFEDDSYVEYFMCKEKIES